MALCVEGHETQAQDFCDQCGMPVVAETAETPEAEEVTACPNCDSPRPGNALFCESCGYDYTTGALPQQDLRTELGLPPVKDPEAEAPSEPSGETDEADDSASEAEESEDATTETDSDEAPATSAPTGPLAKHIPWVAEVWIDPQWYAFQESTDPLPPQGPPRIVPLKESALIGRHSASRNIHPDIDCEPDVGCSRRHAYLTSADGYWYINDLDSANGTFVAPATASLPDEPLTSRIQISPDMRIYVGAWTRIVLRPAIEGEIPAQTGSSTATE